MTSERRLHFYRNATPLIALSGLFFACSHARSPDNVPVSDLPSYGPDAAVLFDDTFAATVFDATIAPPPDWRTKLNSRALGAEAVVRARISTVSSQESEDTRSLELEFTPAGAPLVGRGSATPILVELPARSPSYAVVSVDSSALIGKTVILLYRRYNQDGVATVHWRAEPDNATVTAAVQQTAAARQ